MAYYAQYLFFQMKINITAGVNITLILEVTVGNLLSVSERSRSSPD